MATYIPRVFDSVLKDKLASKGAVLVEGPKWRGKTTTCEQAASTSYTCRTQGRAGRISG